MNMILGEELGDGSFSKVYRAFKVVRGKPRSEWGQFALKRMNEQHRDIATREASMMDRLAHPNCTRLVGMYESLGSVNLVLELAALGDLHSVAAAAGGCLDADAVRFASAEVAAGLQALHDAGLVFGDLKPENVLVHANGHCKLGDFGATREAKAMRKGEAPLEGTLCYLAPELFQRTKLPGDDSGSKCSVIHSPAAIDWWAFGCMVFHLLAGRPPLWAEEEQDMVKSLVGFKVERYPDGFPPRAQVLVDALLRHDPRDRLASRDGALELDSHEFFRALGFPVGEAHAHKAPEFRKGQVRPQQGPWTQRTYSMIVAPLPQSYVGRGSAQSGLPAVQETEQERHKPWVDPDPGKGLRPAAMIATDASPHPAQARAQTSGLSVPAAVFPKVMGSNSSFSSLTAMPGSRRSPAGKGESTP